MTILARRRSLALAALLSSWVATSASALTISEVLYDAVGSDDGLVFVELYGTPGLLLDGYRLDGINGADGASTPSLALSGVIPANGFFVVADSASGGGAIPQADLVLNFDLQNGPDSLVLFDPDGNALDALAYGEFDPGDFFAGEGQAAPDVPAGHSLARLFADQDSNDNLADFAPLSEPTPGVGPLSVPEPRAGELLIASLGVWLALRRSSRPPQGRPTRRFSTS